MVGGSLEWGSFAIAGRDAVGSGYSGGDGVLTTVLGLVAVAAAVVGAWLRRPLVAGLGALAAGGLVIAIVLANRADILGRPDEVRERVPGIIPAVQATIGPGLWLTAAGGLALVAAGVLALAGLVGGRR